METYIISHLVQLQYELTQQRVAEWYNYVYLTWRWFLLLAVGILPWMIFWFHVSRERLLETWLVGSLSCIISLFLDETGSELTLWTYGYKVLPIFPHLIVVDYGILPVGYMLLYQKFHQWKGYIRAITIMAFLYSFVAEPLLEYLDIYIVLNWYHYYSLPIYIVIGIISKWITDKIASKSF